MATIFPLVGKSLTVSPTRLVIREISCRADTHTHTKSTHALLMGTRDSSFSTKTRRYTSESNSTVNNAGAAYHYQTEAALANKEFQNKPSVTLHNNQLQ